MNPRHVGTHLREARERRGLTLRQVAIATRISVNALEALEAGDIARLPGGIFARAFVRGYALEVGLDPEEAVRDFVEQFPVESVTFGSPLVKEVPPPGTTIDADFRPFPGLLVIGAVAAAGLVATALIVVWWRGSVDAQASEGVPRPTAASVSSPPAEAGDGRPGSRPAPAARPATRPVVAAALAGVRVTLVPDGPCWARMTADGREVFTGLLAGGASETREAKELLVLTVGDAAACRFTLNGRPARLLGQPGQVVTVRLTPANASTFWP